MFTEAPAADPNFPPAGQPLYDYATDVEPTQNPTLDRGALLRTASTNGCLLTGNLLDLPPLESSKHEKVHKWVSPPLPQDFELLLLGRGTLELYTRTLNGAVHPGKICVWLYVHKLNLLGVPIDVPVVATSGSLPYFQYSQNPWPSTWTRVSVPLRLHRSGNDPARGEDRGRGHGREGRDESGAGAGAHVRPPRFPEPARARDRPHPRILISAPGAAGR